MKFENSIVKTNKIGKNVRIEPFCLIEEGVEIGNNVVIHSGTKIEDGVKIRDNCEIFPNSYIGKQPKSPGSLTRKLRFDKTTEILENCLIGPNAVIYYDVKIEKNCLIGDGASIRENVEIGEFSVIGRNSTVNYNVKIGKRTKVMDLTVITGNCEIGDNVFVSCLVATTNDKKFGRGQDFNIEEFKGPTIKNNVAIGAGSNILHGVVVEDSAVVAAGSIVTKNVAEKQLVMGSPARFVKNVD